MMPTAQAAAALDLAHKAIMVSDLEKAAQLAHAAAMANHEMGFGKPPHLGDDVIHIGDINVPAPPVQFAPASPAPIVQPPATGLNWPTKAAIMGAALLAGGGLGGLAAALSMRPQAAVQATAPAPPATVAATPPATTPAKPEFDAVTEQLQPDGTWKEIKRERLKGNQ